MNEYITLDRAASDEFVEKKSRFIGYARPVANEQEALDFIAEIKAKHWDAKHNVYAYCIREGNICRYSDDGEPSGTAGIPVLNVLQKNNLTDCAVVVTRYFGGILLGGGGLVRAYSHGAAIGVNAAEIVIMRMCSQYTLSCDYNQYGRINSLIAECGGLDIITDFGADVIISFTMTEDDFDLFKPKLADASNGSVSAEKKGEKYVKIRK